jgi:hypothetical protein
MRNQPEERGRAREHEAPGDEVVGYMHHKWDPPGTVPGPSGPGGPIPIPGENWGPPGGDPPAPSFGFRLL